MHLRRRPNSPRISRQLLPPPRLLLNRFLDRKLGYSILLTRPLRSFPISFQAEPSCQTQEEKTERNPQTRAEANGFRVGA